MKLSSKRRAAIVAATALVLGTATVGVAAAAGVGPFVDVSATHIHVDGITWAKNNGITKGCNPPVNTKYCPDSPTSRGEMGTFVKRMAGAIGAVHVFRGTEVLGPLTSADGWSIWYLNEATGDIALAAQTVQLFFTTTNCTGTAYIWADDQIDAATVTMDGDKQWAVAGPAKEVTYRSSRWQGVCNETGDSPSTLMPLVRASTEITLGRR